METIKTTREQTALLGPDQLAQAAFGTLCQTFAMGILAGSRYEEGLYRQIALELLEEREPAGFAVQNVLQVDLKLVLELLRKSERKGQKTRQLLEQMLRLEFSGKGGGKAGRSGVLPLRTEVRQTAGTYRKTGVLRWPTAAAQRARLETVEPLLPQTWTALGQVRELKPRSAAEKPFFLTASRRTLDALLTAGWRQTVLQMAAQDRNRTAVPGNLTDANTRNNNAAPPNEITQINQLTQLDQITQISGREQIHHIKQINESPLSVQEPSPIGKDEGLIVNAASPDRSGSAGQTVSPAAAVSLGLRGAALFAHWVQNRGGVPLIGQEEQSIFPLAESPASPQKMYSTIPIFFGGGVSGPSASAGQERQKPSPAAAEVAGLLGTVREILAPVPGRDGRKAAQEVDRWSFERPPTVSTGGILTFPVPGSETLAWRTVFPTPAVPQDGQMETTLLLRKTALESALSWETLRDQTHLKLEAEPHLEFLKSTDGRQSLLPAVREIRTVSGSQVFHPKAVETREKLITETTRMPASLDLRQRERSGTEAAPGPQQAEQIAITTTAHSSLARTGASPDGFRPENILRFPRAGQPLRRETAAEPKTPRAAMPEAETPEETPAGALADKKFARKRFPELQNRKMLHLSETETAVHVLPEENGVSLVYNAAPSPEGAEPAGAAPNLPTAAVRDIRTFAEKVRRDTARGAAASEQTLTHSRPDRTFRTLERIGLTAAVRSLPPGTPDAAADLPAPEIREEMALLMTAPLSREGQSPQSWTQGERLPLRPGVTPAWQAGRPPAEKKGLISEESPAFPPEELAYGPVQVQGTAAPTEEPAARQEAKAAASPIRWSWQSAQSDWSFSESPVQSGVGSRPMTAARSIGVLPQESEEKQIQWTAPGLSQQPAELSLRQQEPAAPALPPSPTLSGRELRQAADRIYQMIEDRLRQERRRLDL